MSLLKLWKNIKKRLKLHKYERFITSNIKN